MDPLEHRTSFIAASWADEEHDFGMSSKKKQPKRQQKDASFEKPILREHGDRRQRDKHSSDIPAGVARSLAFRKMPGKFSGKQAAAGIPPAQTLAAKAMDDRQDSGTHKGKIQQADNRRLEQYGGQSDGARPPQQRQHEQAVKSIFHGLPVKEEDKSPDR